MNVKVPNLLSYVVHGHKAYALLFHATLLA